MNENILEKRFPIFLDNIRKIRVVRKLTRFLGFSNMNSFSARSCGQSDSPQGAREGPGGGGAGRGRQAPGLNFLLEKATNILVGAFRRAKTRRIQGQRGQTSTYTHTILCALTHGAIIDFLMWNKADNHTNWKLLGKFSKRAESRCAIHEQFHTQ